MTHTITLSLSDAELEDLRSWQIRNADDAEHTFFPACLRVLLTADLPGYIPTVGDIIDVRPLPGNGPGMRSVLDGERVVAVTDRHVFTEYGWGADCYRREDYQFRPHAADAAVWATHR